MERKNRFRSSLRGISSTLVTVAALHIGTQIVNLGNDFYHWVNPSPLRIQFEKETGFPIKGWAEDIEEDSERINWLIDNIKREQRDLDFKINNWRISSSDYLKQNIFKQLERTVSTPSSGMYCADKISTHGINIPTSVHEIKHAKTYDILEKNPNFIKEWEELAKINGVSPYQSKVGQVLYHVKGLGRLFSEDRTDEENYKDGVISSYSRLNAYEDIAELCSEVECNSDKVLNAIETNENSILEKKLKLAQKYKLIPEGTLDFLKLQKVRKLSLLGRHWINEAKAEEFLEKSQSFLAEHPDSRYVPQITLTRAFFLFRVGDDSEIARTNAINEYKKILKMEDKGENYIFALYELEGIASGEDVKTISLAKDKYFERRRNSDPRLRDVGVNDFLEQRGFSLQ